MDDLTNEEVKDFINHNINLSYDLFNELHASRNTFLIYYQASKKQHF
ncbi:hypothetical protein NWP96_07815 [Mycoplasmopsis cynos]|nr:hypothetical protein [Mycoplasmopsis cynos]